MLNYNCQKELLFKDYEKELRLFEYFKKLTFWGKPALILENKSYVYSILMCNHTTELVLLKYHKTTEYTTSTEFLSDISLLIKELNIWLTNLEYEILYDKLFFGSLYANK